MSGLRAGVYCVYMCVYMCGVVGGVVGEGVCVPFRTYFMFLNNKVLILAQILPPPVVSFFNQQFQFLHLNMFHYLISRNLVCTKAFLCNDWW